MPNEIKIDSTQAREPGITPPMQLSKEEALKSLRDASFSALAILVPQVLEILKVTDFGEYTIYVSLACGILLPLANRYFNVIR